MSKTLTALQYAKKEMTEGRFPNITIQEIAGGFYLGDKDWNLLTVYSTFNTKLQAEKFRSKILDKAAK